MGEEFKKLMEFVNKRLLPLLKGMPSYVIDDLRNILWDDNLVRIAKNDPAALLLATLEVLGIDYLELFLMLNDVNGKLMNVFSEVDSVKVLLLEDYAVSSDKINEIMKSLLESDLIATYKRLISNKEVLRRLISMVRSNVLRRHFESVFLGVET